MKKFTRLNGNLKTAYFIILPPFNSHIFLHILNYFDVAIHCYC